MGLSYPGNEVAYLRATPARGTLLHLEGHLEEAKARTTTTAAKTSLKNELRPFRVYLDSLNLFPVVDWKQKKKGASASLCLNRPTRVN